MITLLTDFGTADYFVPAVKGVLLSINPSVQLIDLTHDIPAQDVAAGAFTLGACYHCFPAGTTHVAVIDPGVGSSRRAIVVQAGQHLFVGPDNGLFSYVFAREEQLRVFQIEREDLFRQPVSATFHGRDVFAPIAAHLSIGLLPESVGRELFDFVKLDIPRPKFDESNRRLIGSILHVDRYGNCITNLTERELPLSQTRQFQNSNLKSGIRLWVAGQRITQFGSHFAEATNRNEMFAYLGSAGYWEIALWCGSAAEKFGIARGDEVTLDY